MESLESQILAEYQALRDEIVATYARRATLQTLGTSLFAGLQTVAFLKDLPLISIAATFLILSFYHDDITLIDAMVKMGEYIRKFIEPHTDGLRWETIMSEDPIRKTPKATKRSLMLLSRYPMTVMVGILLSIWLFAISCPLTGWEFYTCCILIPVLMSLSFFVFMIGSDYGKMHREWRELFESIDAKPNLPIDSDEG
jgi:hypothetical protein